ncbi:MAG TPA: DUF1259 domain-containing protein, partial [Alphaproteobacteria bacterium]|nr:DUF1259 domain-containing protein [Alphaproteobacteria bacterium]
MKKIITLLTIFLLFIATASAESRDAVALDTTQIETLTGAKGEFDPESNVFKVSMPQIYLKVCTAGLNLTPALGLTSWASFNSSDEV